MSRTTLNIDDPILRDLKDLQKEEGKSLGRLVSDLVVEALAHRRKGPASPSEFRWISNPMGAKIDVADKDALYAILDQDLLDG